MTGIFQKAPNIWKGEEAYKFAPAFDAVKGVAVLYVSPWFFAVKTGLTALKEGVTSNAIKSGGITVLLFGSYYLVDLPKYLLPDLGLNYTFTALALTAVCRPHLVGQALDKLERWIGSSSERQDASHFEGLFFSANLEAVADGRLNLSNIFGLDPAAQLNKSKDE